MRKIHCPRRFLADRSLTGRFLGACPREKWSMQKAHLRFTGMIGDGDGEEAGVLVVHMDEIDAAIRRESGEPQAFPVKHIVRDGQGNARAVV